MFRIEKLDLTGILDLLYVVHRKCVDLGPAQIVQGRKMLLKGTGQNLETGLLPVFIRSEHDPQTPLGQRFVCQVEPFHEHA